MMPIRKYIPQGALLALLLLLSACGGTELVVGRHPAGDRSRIRAQKTFYPGEPMALELKNARFRDTLLELVIHSVSTTGKRILSRTMRLPAIDPRLDFLRIPEGLFFLAFPGRYTISITQLGEPMATTEILIREGAR